MTHSKIDQTIRWQRVHLVLAVYGLVISIGALYTASAFLRIPSTSAVSLQRLILISGISLVGILSAFVAVKAYRNKVWAQQIWDSFFRSESLAKGICWGAALGFLFSWIVSFTPVYRFGDFQAYIVRLSPFLNFSILISALTFIVAGIEIYGLHTALFSDTIRAQKKTLLIALVVFTVFCVTWAFVIKTGMGVSVADGFWYISGVPILGLQIVLTFAIGIPIFFVEKSALGNRLPKWSDLFIFFLFWGVTAIFWIREPLPPSFFAPGPYAPDFKYHPFSDAATFDLGSQFALIGQGINNGLFFDRALYMAFLTYLHLLAGQDYTLVIAIQTAIYAVFPAILYLLGKDIHSKSFGAILATLSLLRGINGIAASTMIDVSNQKQMLTDFPTAIFVAWFTLMIVKWLKAPGKNYLYIVWAGGVVGLAVMLRTNTLFLILFAALLIVVIYWRQKMRGIIVGMLLFVVMFAGTFAWGAYHDKSVFDVYLYRIRIVIDARYPQPAAPTPDSPQGRESSPVNQNREVASLSPVFGASAAFHPLTVAAADKELSIFSFAATHFLHNTIMSVLVLPTAPVFHDLLHTVKVKSSFWQPYWDGNMPADAGFFLLINLSVIALGIGAGWRYSKLSGLAPLGVFIFYNFANSLARTSGGRYIVPMDWIVLFYFALGLLQVILWGTRLFGAGDDDFAEKAQEDSAPALWAWEPFRKAPWIMLLFLFIGASLPLSESLFSRRYPLRSQAELLDILVQDGYLPEIGLDKTALTAFSEQWPAEFRIVSGRVLYPRFFVENKGLPKNQFPYSIMGFRRMAFTMIGPEGVTYVLLPGEDFPFFPDGADVFVLGCREGTNLNALAVVVIEEQVAVYTRHPPSPLQCPLQEPVCDNNHNCR